MSQHTAGRRMTLGDLAEISRLCAEGKTDAANAAIQAVYQPRLDRLAALEAQQPAVAELVRAARAIERDGLRTMHLDALRRALEPFAEKETKK